LTGVSSIIEPADLCVHSLSRLPSGNLVQRVWSNVAAAAGHDPCVPAPAETFFLAAPVLPEWVKVRDDGGKEVTTTGLSLGVGEQKTLDIVLYSDGPTEPWSVFAVDRDAVASGVPTLEFVFERSAGSTSSVGAAGALQTMDQGSGVNGDHLRMTVRR